MVKVWSSGIIQKLILQAATNKIVLVGYQADDEKRKKVVTVERRIKGEKKKGRKKTKQDDIPTNVELGFIHEFGSKSRNIPARPHIRTALFKNKEKYKDMNLKAAKLILSGKMTVDTYLERLGVTGMNDIKKEITDISTPANSDETIAKKHSSNPLIDSGQMRNAVTYVVGDKKKIGEGNI